MKPKQDQYKVIQWATGGLGVKCIRAMQEVPYLELVGAWVNSDAKAGRDAGEIAGVGKLGVIATNDIDEICALDADVVHYAAPPIPVHIDYFCRLLESGKNVISATHTCFADPESVERIEAAAQKGNASFYASGIHPDWAASRLVLMASALCHNINKVSVIEQNSHMLAFGMSEAVMFDFLHFGAPPELAQEPSRAGMAFFRVFSHVIRGLAKGMGYEIENIRYAQEVALATEDMADPNYDRTVCKGTIGGWRITVTGAIGGKDVIEFVSYHLAQPHGLSPDWGHYDEASYAVEIDGEPPARICWTPMKGEMPIAEACFEATAMNNLNAIPGICAAPAGIVNVFDIPLTYSYGRLNLSPRSRLIAES